MAEVFEEYRDALAATGSSFEMNYVLNGELPVVGKALRGLKRPSSHRTWPRNSAVTVDGGEIGRA